MTEVQFGVLCGVLQGEGEFTLTDAGWGGLQHQRGCGQKLPMEAMGIVQVRGEGGSDCR